MKGRKRRRGFSKPHDLIHSRPYKKVDLEQGSKAIIQALESILFENSNWSIGASTHFKALIQDSIHFISSDSRFNSQFIVMLATES